ncbi:putative exported protein [Candidatus Ichthyocystis hellenicum]|uniref:Putative exported protein n=1 Tax=Candidatus Ichthyocystis hellenicum TaxID=1561003 RepID=A0A0S4M246_9BURK|nr:hypothetical protein [Candidatus Ichthyocystis hellenicum]CUT17052.1 putative exported protein [Candidatus Ichthyocystis hellenicum]
MDKIGVLFQRLLLIGWVFALSACVSVGNRTFVNQPIHSTFDGPEVSSPAVTDSSIPIYEISGSVTAVSYRGIVTGKIKIIHGSHDDRVTIVSPSNDLLADVVVAGNKIFFRRGSKPPRVELFRDWMRTNFGISTSMAAALSWVKGHPYDEKHAIFMDTDNRKRKCFLENKWLVCIQQPTDSQKIVKKIVQISVPGVNISLSVDR